MPRHESDTSPRGPNDSLCITECLDTYSNPEDVVTSVTTSMAVGAYDLRPIRA